MNEWVKYLLKWLVVTTLLFVSFSFSLSALLSRNTSSSVVTPKGELTTIQSIPLFSL